jgi:hypothetical protein
MNEEKLKTVSRTDLLLADEVSCYMKKIDTMKTWIILAATGQIELNDEEALTHLKDLTILQNDLEALHQNLEAELIIFDAKKAWPKFG